MASKRGNALAADKNSDSFQKKEHVSGGWLSYISPESTKHAIAQTLVAFKWLNASQITKPAKAEYCLFNKFNHSDYDQSWVSQNKIGLLLNIPG